MRYRYEVCVIKLCAAMKQETTCYQIHQHHSLTNLSNKHLLHTPYVLDL